MGVKNFAIIDPNEIDKTYNNCFLEWDITTKKANDSGQLELTIWKNKNAFIKKSRPIMWVQVPLGLSEVKDQNGITTNLLLSDFRGNSNASIKAKLRTLKLYCNHGHILDLSVSEDDD
jgi:hypothetical protein